MDKKKIEKLLETPVSGKIGVLGDFCVDVYWNLAPEKGEISLETGIMTTPVTGARYSLGGAGNIAANLRALGGRNIACFGGAGRDPFGAWLTETLDSCGMVKILRPEYHTPVYCKPLKNGVEQSRLDLGNVPMTDEESDLLLQKLEERSKDLNVIIINEQLAHGVHSAYFRKNFAQFVSKTCDRIRFVFDGRDFLDAYPGVILKINASAASHLAFGEDGHAVEESGLVILKRSGTPLVVTDGENGSIVFEHAGVTRIPAIRYDGPIDIVGAGDSYTAGFAYALARGASMVEAAELGTCCSSVTIRKLNQTGTATPEEIFAIL